MHPGAFGDRLARTADFLSVLDDPAFPGNARKSDFVTEANVFKGGYIILRAVAVSDKATFPGGDIRKDDRDVVVRVNDEGRPCSSDIQEIVRIH
jgi:hypothetical protein